MWRSWFDNLPLKLLAVVMAFLLWLNVNTANPVQKDVEVPLEFVDLPTDRALYFEPERRLDRVKVRLRGPKNQIEAIGAADVTVRIDLSNAPLKGEMFIDFLRDSRVEIGAPFAVQAQGVEPPSMVLLVDRKLRRRVRVIPALSGSPPEGFNLDGYAAEPSTVEIEGPETLVSNIHLVTTEGINLQEERETLQRVVRLRVNPQLDILGTDHVRVTARITEVEQERWLEDVRVEASPAGASVQPQRLNVQVRGPGSLVRAITPDQVKAVVAVGNADSNRWIDLAPKIEFTDERFRRLQVLTLRPASIRARLLPASS